MEVIIADFHRLGYEGFLPDNVQANLEFLKELDRTWQNKRNIVDKFRLVDIFASALRREKQKKYDDAVGRLYRCLEMCATMKLISLGLEDTAKPNYESFCSRIEKTPEWLKGEFKERKHRELPEQGIGLDDQMTFLQIAGDHIGNIYRGMKNTKDGSDSLMDIRNRSILAHGTNPIPEALWPEFKRKTEAIIAKAIGKAEFQKLLAMAMHGQLRLAP